MKEEIFLSKIALACEGGVTLVQLREKELNGHDFYNLAVKVKSVTDRFGVPLIIDGRADIAMAIDAAGVHLGQTDLPIAAVRSFMGNGKIIGATAKTVSQAHDAEAAGADYLWIGAMYPTKAKIVTALTPVRTLLDIISEVKIPVVAIGGLNASNLPLLYGSGASGIAVVRAIMDSKSPREAAEELFKITRTHINRRA